MLYSLHCLLSSLVLSLLIAYPSLTYAQEPVAVANETPDEAIEEPPPPKMRLGDDAHTYAGRVYKYLTKIPMWAEEDFLSYLLRVRWTMRHGEDPALEPAILAVEAIRDRLRGHPSVWNQLSHELMPILLGRWAASYRRAERIAILKKTNRLALSPAYIQASEAYVDRLATFQEDIEWIVQTMGMQKSGQKLQGDQSIKIALPAKKPRRHHGFQEQLFQMWAFASVEPRGGLSFPEGAFSAIESERNIFGYGLPDQHGPMLAALYALGALANSGLSISRSPELFIAERVSDFKAVSDAVARDQIIAQSQLVFGGPFPFSAKSAQNSSVSFIGDVQERNLQLHGDTIWEDAPVGGDEARLIRIENIEQEDGLHLIRAVLHPESRMRGELLMERLQKIVRLKNDRSLRWQIDLSPRGNLHVEAVGLDQSQALGQLIPLLSDFATLSPGPCTGVLQALKDFRTRLSAENRLSEVVMLVEDFFSEGLDGCQADFSFEIPKSIQPEDIVRVIEEWYARYGEDRPDNNMRFTISSLKGFGRSSQKERHAIPYLRQSYEVVADRIAVGGGTTGMKFNRHDRDIIFWGPFDDVMPSSRQEMELPYISEVEFDRLVTLYAVALAQWSI